MTFYPRIIGKNITKIGPKIILKNSSRNEVPLGYLKWAINLRGKIVIDDICGGEHGR